MLEVYDKIVAECQTLNQLGQRHLSIELTLTPAEMVELQRQLVPNRYWDLHCSNTHLEREAMRAASTAWLSRLRVLHDCSGKSRPEPFLREELLRSVTRYSDGKGRAGKWLVITFCGAAYRAMMSSATYLQLFDAATTDVVMVRDYYRKGFRRGVTELSNSIEETFARLPVMLDASSYAGVSIVGTSGGAVASLQYAMATGAHAAVAAGPSPPYDPARRLRDGRLPAQVLQSLAERRPLPRMALLYGRESLDRPAAEAVAAIVPVTLFEITAPDQKVGHNALWPLLLQGRLGDFLAEHLDLPPSKGEREPALVPTRAEASSFQEPLA